MQQHIYHKHEPKIYINSQLVSGTNQWESADHAPNLPFNDHGGVLTIGADNHTSHIDNFGNSPEANNYLDGDIFNTRLYNVELTESRIKTIFKNESSIIYSDSDDDGLSDGYEVYVSLSDPNNSDSDDDGLSDGYEVNISLSDPNNSDSDGDGLSDQHEVNSLTDPNSYGDPNQVPIITDYEFTMMENNLQVGVINAIDLNQDNILFSISGTNASLFEINEISGELTFKSAPDYDVDTTNYTLEVITTETDFSMPFSDLLIYLPLDENALDVSGNNHHGIDSDVVYSNNFAYFNGESSQISLPSMSISPTFTINTWVNLSSWNHGNDVNHYVYLLDDRQNGFSARINSYAIDLRVVGQNGGLFHNRAAYNVSTSPNHFWTSGGSGLELDSWAFLTWTYDGRNVKTYVNSVLLEQHAANYMESDVIPQASPLWISGYADRLHGGLKHFSIFQREISEEERDYIYMNSIPKEYFSSTNTISITITDDRAEDFDGDGLTEAQEEDVYGTSDRNVDTDGDGLTDGYEVNTSLTDPTVPDTDGDGLTDGYEVNNPAIEKYEVIMDYKLWLDAKDDATSKGGHLVTINSSDEWNSIKDILDIYYPQLGINWHFWLGASDQNNEGQWEWVTGEPWVFTAWKNGEPNGGLGENYLVSYHPPNYEWTDFPNSYTCPYIIEYEIVNTDPNNPDTDGDGISDGDEVSIYNTNPLKNGDQDNDGLLDQYEVNTSFTNPNNPDTDGDGLSDFEEIIGIISIIQSNRYVYVKDSSFTWQEARDDAVQQGGHLATVNTHEEWNTILDLHRAENGNYAWLGGTDENNEGQWEWVTGEPWNDDIDYWSEYQGPQPDNGLGIEHYLEIWVNEEWNDATSDKYNNGYILEFPNLYSTNNINTNPNNPDTDGDGLSDGYEENTSFTNPNNPDTDGDGLTDLQEINIYLNDDKIIATTAFTNPDNSVSRFNLIRLDEEGWLDSKLIAEDTYNGLLACITTNDEWNHIYNFLQGQLGNDGYKNVYLGGTDQNIEGQWEWISGEPWVIDHWRDGEPNDKDGEDFLCVMSNSDWNWNDTRDAQYDADYYMLVESFVTDPNDNNDPIILPIISTFNSSSGNVDLYTSIPDQQITYTVVATDNVGISIVSIPEAIQVSQSGDTYTFSETFNYADYSYGNSAVTRTVTVSDIFGNSSTETITLNVAKIDNQTPTISLNTFSTSIELRSSEQTQTITYSVTATDNVGISIVSIPEAIQVSQNGDTYTFSETFNYADYSYGNSAVTRTVTVTDNAGNVATDSITLNVAKIDDQSPAVSLSVDNTSINLFTSIPDQQITYTVVATDNVGISIVSIPEAIQVSQSGDTYTFSETFNYADYSYGNSAVTRTVTVSDIFGNSSTETITLNVAKIDNQTPTISLNTFSTSIELRSSEQTQTITYSVTATDNVGISIVSIPEAIQVSQNGDTYTFSETFNYADYSYGNSAVTRTVTVTDNAGNVSFQTITITINKINSPPIFSSSNIFLVLENANNIGTLNATDPDGDEITYNVVETNSISLSLDSTTGELTFEELPDYEQDATNYVCVFSASDENGASSFTTNTINITDDRTEDFDGDGLTEAQEEDDYGTSDLLSDMDGDGLSDYQEVITYITDPNDQDSDGDGLTDRDEVIKSTYSLIEGSFTWQQARDEAMSRGGHLATVTSSNEWNTIVDLWETASPNIYWLGASDEEQEGVWKWITGENWTVEFWDDVNPNNGGGEEHMLTIEHRDGIPFWNDSESWGVRSFILETTNSKLFATNPNDSDSDNDGLSDYDEVITYETDPLTDADKDNDDFTDSDEVNEYGTDPSDANSYPVWNVNISVNGDGNITPLSGTYKRGTNITFTATEGTGYLFTGWYGDLLSDPINMSLSTNILISTNLSIVGTFSDDADGDGLTNTEENALGSNPWLLDSDGDELDDPIEVGMTNMVFTFNPTLNSQDEINRFRDMLENIP